MLNYKKKYLKYKLKYQQLLKQKGGSSPVAPMNSYWDNSQIYVTNSNILINNYNRNILSDSFKEYLESSIPDCNIDYCNKINHYLDNLLNNGLYILCGHGSVINKTFKTNINIIFTSSVGVCTEEGNFKDLIDFNDNIININYHNIESPNTKYKISYKN